MKNNRLFGIIYLLLSHDTMTAKELANYFEVSMRTIYRDIESLSELNIPIYMNKGKNGGIHLLDDYKLDKTLLSDKEQNEILFSLQGVNKLQLDTNNTYEKLKNIFSKQDDDWLEVDFSVWGNSDQHKENMERIKRAIINKDVISFSYFNSYGTNSERKVEPLKLYFKYNAWYLCGFDQGKQDYRFFKTMRMKHLNLLDETFDRIMNVDLKQTDRKPEMIQLVLQIDKKLAYRVYDEFDASKIEELENGDFIISVEFPFNDWIYGFILSFGEYMKVIEPLHVKKEIIKRLQKTLANYS